MGNVLSREKREQVVALSVWAGPCGGSRSRREFVAGRRAIGLRSAGDPGRFGQEAGGKIPAKTGHFGDHLLGRFK